MSLSKPQLAELRDAMQGRSAVLKGEIEQKIGESIEDLGDREVGDSGDFSQAITNSELDISEAKRDIAEWRSLQAAMRRMDEGSYGICIDCGVDIPFERLQVQPSALRCIRCQTQAEKAGAA